MQVLSNGKQRNPICIFLLCTLTYLIFFIFQYILTDGKMGVPLDDTWIHFQFADNFSKGNFFQFNPGEYTAGTTSPLYVIVLGTFSFITQHFIFNSVFLSASFHFLCCLFIYRVSLIVFENNDSLYRNLSSGVYNPESISMLTALLTILNGRFAWSALSGMETTMFTFFCILGVYFHIKNLKHDTVNLYPALFLTLATISRPEGFLFFTLYLFDLSLNLYRSDKLKTEFRIILFSVIIFLIVTVPYLIFSYKISGHFFPNTFRGQGGSFHLIPNYEYVKTALLNFLKDNPFTGVFYIVSVFFYVFNLKKYFSELKYLNLIFLWIILLPLVSSVLIPNWRHHVRYLFPVIPFINLVSVFVFFKISGKVRFSRFRQFVSEKKYVLYLIPVFSLVNYFIFAAALGFNTDNINSQQVKLANWVKSNVSRNETIAVNDIGAIGFISKNRIIDMAGLITPEILKYRTYTWDDNLDSLNYLLKKNNVTYIIIYDEWFKEYLAKYGNELTFLTSAYLENNTICGGDEMKVYKTNFNKLNP